MTTKPDETPARDPESPVEHDVAVVGGGAAGLAAAVFTARYGLETTVFDGGKSAIKQCAYIENYLGFPDGITPDRFLRLGRKHAEGEGATVVDKRVTDVRDRDTGFIVETTETTTVAGRVVVAAAYDGDVLEPLASDLPEPEPFAPTENGRTDIDGLYVAGWMSDETEHQVGINAGHGARVGLALARDDMSERYWDSVGERYVDWVVHEGRYGGEGWDEHVDEWFEQEMLPEASDVDTERIDGAREDLKEEFLDRCIDDGELRRRDREGQRRLLEKFDEEVVMEYAAELEERGR
jgi:NADPH-dependent 2,4-dienoyl-CoA reductase/sulfur reductase-like enzyme